MSGDVGEQQPGVGDVQKITFDAEGKPVGKSLTEAIKERKKDLASRDTSLTDEEKAFRAGHQVVINKEELKAAMEKAEQEKGQSQ